MGKIKPTLTVEEAQFYARAALYAYKTPDELSVLERQYDENPADCILAKFYDRINPRTSRPKSVIIKELEFHYAEYNNEIIFMIPGTRKRPDAFVTDFNTDFNMDLVRTELFGGEEILIHRGFFERYKLLRTEILKIVDYYGSKKSYCSVGHSLGAAMSILISLELRLKNHRAWTFLLSPPKVGAPCFNELVARNVQDIWRFIRVNDFLPKLSPIAPYEHFGGKEVRIDQSNRVWPILTTIAMLAMAYFDSKFALFLVCFMLTLVGAQLTHATETYVSHVDRLKSVQHSEALNYPKNLNNAAQWMPILVMVIFAYARMWTKNTVFFIRSKYQKTILARLLKRAIKPSTSNS